MPQKARRRKFITHANSYVTMLALFLAAGCEVGAQVSFKPLLIPVTFALASDGKISVSAGEEVITPIGTITVEGDLSSAAFPHYSATRQQTVVTLRHQSPSGLVDDSYRLDANGGFHVEAQGLTKITQTGSDLDIDLSQANLNVLEIEPGGNNTQTNAATAPTCGEDSQLAVASGSGSQADAEGDTVGYPGQPHADIDSLNWSLTNCNLTVKVSFYAPTGQEAAGISFSDDADNVDVDCKNTSLSMGAPNGNAAVSKYCSQNVDRLWTGSLDAQPGYVSATVPLTQLPIKDGRTYLRVSGFTLLGPTSTTVISDFLPDHDDAPLIIDLTTRQ